MQSIMHVQLHESKVQTTKTAFVPGYKHVFSYCKIGHFNNEVYVDFLEPPFRGHVRKCTCVFICQFLNVKCDSGCNNVSRGVLVCLWDYLWPDSFNNLLHFNYEPAKCTQTGTQYKQQFSALGLLFSITNLEQRLQHVFTSASTFIIIS